jgi:hypothetical protein
MLPSIPAVSLFALISKGLWQNWSQWLKEARDCVQWLLLVLLSLLFTGQLVLDVSAVGKARMFWVTCRYELAVG